MKKPRHQLLVRFGYDGSRFHGLQPQAPHILTAGGALRERLEDAFGEKARALCFAGRTDSGVHALSNVATTWITTPLSEPMRARAVAPRDDGLFMLRIGEVDRSVHARGSSLGKEYRYIVDAGGAGQSAYSWQIEPRLDIEKLRLAAQELVGTHDFTSFRARRCSAPSPIKCIHRIVVDGPYPVGGRQRYFITIRGDGFLRKMIRNLVGVLIEIASGWRQESAAEVLARRDRRRAGLCAPASGLTMIRVMLAEDHRIAQALSIVARDE